MAEYLIQGETLSNIAEAIREKAGITGDILPGTMPGYIRNIQTGSVDTSGVPADIVAEAERVASSINSKKAANAITFLAMSDMHELGNNDLDMSNATNVATFERNCRSNRNAGQAAKLISDKVALDFFANLGDLAFGRKSVTTTTDGVECMRRALLYTADLMLDNESFITPGNHDTLTYSQSINGGFLSPGVMDGLIGTYRYKDFDSKKVRVICLNTADNGGSSAATYSSDTGTERISGEQLQWFAEALDLSGKSNASEWGIIILSHHPLDWNNVKVAGNCLAAYLSGSSYSVTHNGVSVSKNFSGKNAAKVIAAFHGHTHCFKVDYINDFRSGSAVPTTVQRVAIPNAYYDRNNEYGTTATYGVVWGEAQTYKKSDNGTGKNTAFCVVSIDLNEKIIYADCFGAGYDRIVSYGEKEVNTYSITTNLSNASISNGTSTILEGEPFAAVITADNGYKLESAKVTMGGVDITSTAYSNGNISISSVTGDIVITATAVSNIVYDVTNLVPISEEQGSTALYNGTGYKNGVYLSSDGGEGTDATCVTTGYIPFEWTKDQVIYIRGASVTTASHVRIYGYNGKDVRHSDSAACSGSTLTTYFTVEQLEDKYYKLTVKNTKGTNYIRFSLIGTGANLIVTVNEPIESSGGDQPGGGDQPSTGNLVPTSIDTNGSVYNGKGYKEGYRLSSGGTETQTSGAVVSGFIPYDGQIVRVWGSTTATAGTSGNYIGFYKESNASFEKLVVVSGTAGGVTYESLNGKYLMTFDKSGLSASNQELVAQAKYIRCSFGACSDPTAFTVTLDEPIE